MLRYLIHIAPSLPGNISELEICSIDMTENYGALNQSFIDIDPIWKTPLTIEIRLILTDTKKGITKQDPNKTPIHKSRNCISQLQTKSNP